MKRISCKLLRAIGIKTGIKLDFTENNTSEEGVEDVFE